MRYIRESERNMQQILSEHIGYINNRHLRQATGYHFNKKGHSSDNVTITILEKVKKMDTQYRKEREKFLIRKFNTYYNGINRMP